MLNWMLLQTVELFVQHNKNFKLTLTTNGVFKYVMIKIDYVNEHKMSLVAIFWMVVNPFIMRCDLGKRVVLNPITLSMLKHVTVLNTIRGTYTT